MSEFPCLYFGCWRVAGHYLWAPERRSMFRVDGCPFKADQLDGTFCGDPRLRDHHRGEYPGDEKHQPQGVPILTQVDGWTIVGFWDRTGDSRYACNSVFLAPGELTRQEVFTLAREYFPEIWERVKGILKAHL